ncbi:MAG: hypothetical protein GY827_03325 [Cytophagales bacterium]|nr:hypothetical protein [Cytophagales bacterium]
MSIDSVSISTDTISIQLNESTNTETSPSGLSLSLSTPVYTDGNGNTVESFTSETLDDKALPIKLSTQTIDSDDNYKADQIILSFSENIS